MQASLPTNPLSVAAYVAGLVLTVPVIVAGVKAVFFFATATKKLDDVVSGLDALKSEVREYRHTKNDRDSAVDLNLTLIENDVNVLQERAGVPVRPFPDRRTGPVDRRQAS